MRRMRWFLGILLCLCAVLTPVFLTFSVYSDLPEAPTSLKEADCSDVTRVLVMGCDRSQCLTDAIFVVALRGNGAEVSVLQIPRDTYANYTQRDYKKINGAWKLLKEDSTKEFFSGFLGVPIHAFAVLDLEGLNRMVDAAGGVDLVIPQDMTYSDPAQELEIRLQAGPCHLDGKSAEQFVRYRSGYANADLGRLDAQKLFLQALTRKMGELTAAQRWKVMGVALTAVQTDLPLQDMIRLFGVFSSYDADRLQMATLPGQAVQGNSGAWYYTVNRAGACRTVNQYLFPISPLEMADFDREGLLDRPQNPKFHAIYTAPEEDLP
ncbi:MAG: LCP family protein, partial [Clostridia bacterium]|nr:LCP family protein [Clostridia bacterium]